MCVRRSYSKPGKRVNPAVFRMTLAAIKTGMTYDQLRAQVKAIGGKT